VQSHSSSVVAGIVSRDRLVVVSCIVLVTALAWVYLFHLDEVMTAAAAGDSMMARMGMTAGVPWSARDFLFAFAMWALMMVGMMLPSAAPLILLFMQMRTSRNDEHSSTKGLLFGAAHVSVWIAFSGVAALLQWALHTSALLSPEMSVISSRAAGVILIGAGAYQLSPLKSACLTRCQSPLGFLLSNWREGAKGAVQMGLRHGTYCLGCCWALMFVLFVVGVMNLAWVAALTVFILLEKITPAGVRVARVSGAAIIVAGLFSLAG
jgi:predicted metal-binding membrane protein